MYPAFSFQVRRIWDVLYLALDFDLQVKNVLSVAELLKMFPESDLIGRSGVANWNGWQRGKVLDINEGLCSFKFFDLDAPQNVPVEKVIPNIKTRLLDDILLKRGIVFDLGKAIKQASLGSQPNAARSRAAETEAAITDVATSVFPITLATGPVCLFSRRPLQLREMPARFQIYARQVSPSQL